MARMNSASKAPYVAKDLSIRNLKHSLAGKGTASPKKEELSLRLASLNHLQGSVFLAPHHANLKQVDIRNNRLSDLPGEICTLSHLTHLRLDYNYLQALPFSLGNLSGLQYLSASQNRLQELPDSLFRHSSRLQTLLVNDNKIGAVQKSLGSLVNLKQLFLHSNLLVEMPTSLSQLTKLAEFSLDWLLYTDDKWAGTSKSLATEFVTADAAEDQAGDDESGRKTAVATFQELALAKQDSAEKAVAAPAGNKKVLRGEKGAAMIKEIRLLMAYIDQAQHAVRQGHQATRPPASPAPLQQEGSGYAHFVQFVMYFQRLDRTSQVRDLVFKHKSRALIHLLAIHGHLYLLRSAVAVLGMNRPETSLDVNALDEDKSTALVLALKQKRFEFVKYLLRLPQISTRICSARYGLPLHVALAQCEFKLAVKLLKRQERQTGGADSVDTDVNVPNEQGNTAMHLVFHHFGQAPELATVVAKLLIRRGADLHARNKAELGVLHCAA